jgi:hypothetical protein
VLAEAKVLVRARQILRLDAQMQEPALLVEVEHHLEDYAASRHEITLLGVGEVAGTETSRRANDQGRGALVERSADEVGQNPVAVVSGCHDRFQYDLAPRVLASRVLRVSDVRSLPDVAQHPVAIS